TTSESWLSRLMEAVKSVVIGLLLFVGSFPLLWWNDGGAGQTYKSLQQGGAADVSLENDEVDGGEDSKRVNVVGKAITGTTLRDREFGIAVNALQLRRRAEMYQWVESVKTEKKKKVGGGEETTKTYTYTKEWKGEAIDSSRFQEPRGHGNPGGMLI